MARAQTSVVQTICAGLLVAIGIAFLVALIPTTIDWYGNPGQIFRDQTGTQWGVVVETWFSWFWPLALVLSLIVVPVFVMATLAEKRAQGRQFAKMVKEAKQIKKGGQS